ENPRFGSLRDLQVDSLLGRKRRASCDRAIELNLGAIQFDRAISEPNPGDFGREPGQCRRDDPADAIERFELSGFSAKRGLKSDRPARTAFFCASANFARDDASLNAQIHLTGRFQGAALAALFIKRRGIEPQGNRSDDPNAEFLESE